MGVNVVVTDGGDNQYAGKGQLELLDTPSIEFKDFGRSARMRWAGIVSYVVSGPEDKVKVVGKGFGCPT